ncbi:hypothetical protein EW145_g786 [Phellinidium pouzarii]|uniref:SET domain-containing protein n=1 Tax=Phellinidium pouzarii TaxID=167371 RepID=A0A4S4LHI9_9AGAM|nr:hypothetical protein EW145_g786 [Phellinidium pouzarii]
MAKKKKSLSLTITRSASRESDADGDGDLPTLPPSDFELFQPSDTPEEDYGEDADKQWPVKKIASEEIDLFNRKIFQIEWDEWHRPDGTNTTWSDSLPGANSLSRSWNVVQGRQRNAEARETADINLVTLSSYMPHNIRTAESVVAYSEKLRRWKIPQDDWDAESNQARHSTPSSGGAVSQTAKKRKRTNSDIRLTASDADGNRVDSMTTSTRVTCDEWNKRASSFGASGITITNEVDDEEAPPVGADFVYLEGWCIYDKDVPRQDPGFLIGCECKEGCKNALLCSCLMDSQCIDDDGDLTTAYDKKGLFLFSNQLEVIECNIKCRCNNCHNKAAQAPRKIPLNIFKTTNNGWGVRPSVDVRKGTVLGLYTGLIMKRETVTNLPPEWKDYTFDLDARDDDPDCTDKHTICAYSAGNWTRFINHSCGPVAKVYSVVTNTAVHMNMPHIAFVACEDIPAGKEITIDYKPAAAWDGTRKKSKGKMKKDLFERRLI